MNRRAFIKAALEAAAFLGVCPVLSCSLTEKLAPSGNDIKKYVTGCMWCQCGCSMIVHIRGNQAVHVSGNPDDPLTRGNICIKPYGSLALLNSDFRLTHPLKRIGSRGVEADFVKIGWKQALDEIANKLISIRKKDGARALGIWACGRSSSDGRKLNSAFAKLYGTPNYEKTGPFCNYSAKPAGESIVGTRYPPWIYTDDDFFGADLYVLIGSNLEVTRPVLFQRLQSRVVKGDCDLVVVDPRCTNTAKHASTWLPIRPGSDLAFALCLIHHVIIKDLIDHEFVDNHTIGFETLKQEVLSKEYDLSWGAKITGIPEKQLEYLGNRYAVTKKSIMLGNTGISHHANAVQTHRALYLLAAITGHFGGKSMGYGCLNNGGTSTGEIPLSQDQLPQPDVELCKSPAGWFDPLENDAYPYKLKALISAGSPLTQWPNQSAIRKAIAGLELSVYNGLTRNINAYYFDYILPAATWIESGGLAPVSDESRFVWVPKLIEPPGEAKPDRWWWVELGQRMGWKDIFTDELKEPEALQNFVGADQGYLVENFIQNHSNALRAPISVSEHGVTERDTLFLDKVFHTKSKKAELWSEDLEIRFQSYGLTAIPHYYTDPDIARENEPTIAYHKNELVHSIFQGNKTLTTKVGVVENHQHNDRPFYLITGRPSQAIMGHTSHWIEMLSEVSPHQFCAIHVDAAEELGIQNHDKVKIWT